ncbi:MAG: PepSY-like domain-containing protein [Verrucomicrobia bacterium]|nr:PepSY-like domain-containing protein [Verrucomicrobiota bacterium]
MKKSILVAALALGLGTAAFAQKNEVPVAVKTAFEKQYPGIKAKWDDENGKYEAGFKYQGQEMSAVYAATGTLEETEVEIPIKNLPAAVHSYVADHKMGKIKEAAKITKANGTVEYEAEVKGGDAIFNADGKFIKIVKD